MSKSLNFFIKNVELLLEHYQWKQTDLAKRAGIETSSLSLYVNGKRSPRLKVIDAIADAFGVEAYELLRDPSSDSNVARLKEVKGLVAAAHEVLKKVSSDLPKSQKKSPQK